MLIDTHCHLNMMVKKEFDVPLKSDEIAHAQIIINEAEIDDVRLIINVGTNLVESNNCLELAKQYKNVYAAIGIHPNDYTSSWRDDLKEMAVQAKRKQELRIVAIGECGMDFHYPDYNVAVQKDVFKAQIELALEHDLALIVHTRSAPDETLRVIEEFNGQIKRGVIHCFSEDQQFADTALSFGFVLGIGGIITYPKNNTLRSIFTNIALDKFVLETDAPFLPPQAIRGQQNHPRNIATIAQYIADLRQQPFREIAAQTTDNAKKLFKLL